MEETLEFNRDLTPLEELMSGNLIRLGWKLEYIAKIRRYDTGDRIYPTSKITHAYPIQRFQMYKWLFDPTNKQPFYMSNEHVYLLPTGEVTVYYDRACKVVFDELGLGGIQ